MSGGGTRVDRLQRLAVRMTIDPAFAEGVLAGRIDPGIDAESLGWLRAVDRRAWGAERGRAEQMLGNLAGELPLSVRLADRGTVESFPSSDAFHRAIAEDSPLPLAFADHLLARAEGRARDVTRLEAEMARARRLRPPRPPAEIRLAPGVRLVALAAGTVAWASAALDAAASGRWMLPPAGGREVAVLAPRPSGRWRAPDVHVEVIAGAVLDVIERAAIGLQRGEIPALARACDGDPAELSSLVSELVGDGILDSAGADA